MFLFSIVGTWISKIVKPGIYLIYGQTFASGSFLSLALLHFLPDTISDFLEYKKNDTFPYYSIIIVFIFVVFCIAEIRAVLHVESNQTDFYEVSDDSSKDFSVFLMHRFTAIPSGWLRIFVFIVMVVHSVILGYVITSYLSEKYFSILIATITEKVIESFTISIISRKDKSRPFVFWTLMIGYALVTPLAIILFSYINIDSNPLAGAIFSSISTGLFFFIGILLWRKTFLTPFDWQKMELFIVSVVFVGSIALQALTSIDFDTKPRNEL